MSAIAPRSRAGLVCLGLLTSATLAFAADDTALRLFNADAGNSGYVRVANSPWFLAAAVHARGMDPARWAGVRNLHGPVWGCDLGKADRESVRQQHRILAHALDAER